MATPVISNVTGTFAHGGTITISGSNFGTKSPVAPIVWDPCNHGQSVITRWDGFWPDNAADRTYDMDYRVAQRSIPMPHSRTTKYLCGSHNPGGGAETGNNVMVWKNFTASLPETHFMSWRQRFDDAWVFGISAPPDDNLKDFDFSEGTSPYNPENYYGELLSESGGGPHSASDPPSHEFHDDASTITELPGGDRTIYGSAAVNPMAGAWSQIEQAIIYAASSGVIQRRENGSIVLSYSGPTDLYAGTARSEAIGGYARAQGNTNNWRYYEGLYLDYTLARVQLWTGDGVVREMQIPSAWGENEITCTMNLGVFGDTDNAYIVVVNASGEGAAFGVTLGAGPPATFVRGSALGGLG